MNTKRVATIWAENGWIKIRAPYSEQVTPLFVEELKSNINWKLRQWSASEKVWMVDPSALDTLVEIAKKYYAQVTVLNNSKDTGQEEGYDQFRFRGNKASKGNGEYTVMAELLQAASMECLKKVYKVMVVEFHPDRGGDPDTMKRLNTIWDKICQQRGER